MPKNFFQLESTERSTLVTTQAAISLNLSRFLRSKLPSNTVWAMFAAPQATNSSAWPRGSNRPAALRLKAPQPPDPPPLLKSGVRPV